MDEFDVAIHTIGGRENLTDKDLRQAVKAYRLILLANPGLKECHLVLHGWDEDEREIWDIPEACAYIRKWAKAAGVDTYSGALAGKIHEWSIGLLAKCGAMRDMNDSNVRVVPGLLRRD